jgi:hypothetical protein
MYCFVEIKDKEIISYGEATSIDAALIKTKGMVMEISENQLKMVYACHGDLSFGRMLLELLETKIARAESYTE